MSDSVRPHRQQPTRLPRPWESPGKNTGVGCHFLLQGMKVKSESEVAQSCPTYSDPMDCSPPGSSIHGIFQARVLEWGAIAFSLLMPRCLFFIFGVEDFYQEKNCGFFKKFISTYNSLNITVCSLRFTFNSGKHSSIIVFFSLCFLSHSAIPIIHMLAVLDLPSKSCIFPLMIFLSLYLVLIFQYFIYFPS